MSFARISASTSSASWQASADRGQVVAMLIPSAPAATLLDRLIADGRATPPSRDPASLPAAPTVKVTAAERRRIWEAYEATRADRL